MVCAMSLQQEQFQQPEEPPQGTFAPLSFTAQTSLLRISPVFLQATDIPTFLDVQARLRPHLTSPYHLKERDEKDLLTHLSERMPLIGAKIDDGSDYGGDVVGGCLLSLLKNEEGLKHITGYPVDHFQKPTTAVVQSLCIDPTHRGRKIAQTILDAAFATAAEKGMTQILSAIADDNAASIKTFTEAGYTPIAHGYDSIKGYAKTFYRLRIGCAAAATGVALKAKIA